MLAKAKQKGNFKNKVAKAKIKGKRSKALPKQLKMS